MKKWMETRQVLDRLAELRSEGRRAALATVVSVRGSAYRHEGAKMVVADDGSATGNVSGGCLEADVREVALRVIETGVPELREYCGSADEIAAWDLGVGCEGVVRVHVRLAARDEAARYADVRERLSANEPFAWCTDLQTGAATVVAMNDATGSIGDAAVDAQVAQLARQQLPSGVSTTITVASRNVFVDAFTPPPTLLIVGRGDDARVLAELACMVGFVAQTDTADTADGADDAEESNAVPAVAPTALAPTAVAPTAVAPPALALPAVALPAVAPPALALPAVALPAVAPPAVMSFAVVMSHHYATDREALRRLLASNFDYIGMLGPRQRTERIIAELSATGPVDESRIYGPVGLDIGTDGAEQVAMAIIAEMLAVRSGRRPASLRERRAPIHAMTAD